MADRVAINRPQKPRPRPHRVWYQNGKLLVIFSMGVVTTLYSLTEIVIALRFASLVMLTDGLHNFSDAGALAVGFWAENKKLRFGTDGLTYGWRRTELLGGLFNGFFLLSMSVFVMLEAIPKFITPEVPNRDGDMQFIVVSGAGIFINVVGTILFSIFGGGHGHSHGGGGGGHGHAHGGEKSKKDKGHGHAHGSHSSQSSPRDAAHGHAHSHAHQCDSDTDDDDDMHRPLVSPNSSGRLGVPSHSAIRPSSGSMTSGSSSGIHRQLSSAIGTPRRVASTHGLEVELAASLPAEPSRVNRTHRAVSPHSDDDEHGHGHSHGHGHGHGSPGHDDEDSHAHASAHAHGDESDHGHSHSPSKAKSESHGHGDHEEHAHAHGHGDSHHDDHHGHAHGKKKSQHAHSINDDEEEEEHGEHARGGHGHAHGSGSRGHGHAHGSEHDEHHHGDDDDDDSDHGHHDGRDHNMWGLFIHFLGDVLTSILVLGVGIIYYFSSPQSGSTRDDWVNYMDPAASILSVAIIVSTVWPLIKACSWILLQSSPAHVNLSRLRRDILALPSVRDVHELHVWQLVDGVSIGSVHVVTDSAFDLQDLVGSVKSVLHRHGIHSSSIQPELQPRALAPSQSSSACVVAGSCVQNCEGETCCPPRPLLADA